MKTTGIATVMVTVALFATACGGSDDDGGNTAGLDTGGWERLTVTDVSPTGVGLTLSAEGSSSTGGLATIIPVGDSKAYYLKGMTAKVLDASEEQAVLSLNWSAS